MSPHVLPNRRSIVLPGEQILNAAFWHSPVASCLCDPEGGFLEVNAAFCAFVGYSRRELLDADFRLITHADDIAMSVERFRDLVTGKRSEYSVEKRYVHRDGHVLHGLLACAVVRDGDATTRAVLAQVQDITRRVETEESLRHWEQTFDGHDWTRASVHPKPATIASAQAGDSDEAAALEETRAIAINHACAVSGRLTVLSEAQLVGNAIESFDRFTQIACRLLNVPVALVSLVDDRRQYFSGAEGLPEPWATSRETPLSHSICQHVVQLCEPLVVCDAANNPVVGDNRAIPDLGVAAYLGVPIHAPDGTVLGSFCAIDTIPRRWTRSDLEVLESLTEAVCSEVALRLQKSELEEKSESLKRSEERYRLAINGSNEGVWDWKVDEATCRFSTRYRELLGVTAAEFPNLIAAWRARLHPEDVRSVIADLQHHFDTRDPYEAEYRLRTSRGDYRWFRSRGSAIWNEDGHVERMVGSIADITDQRLIERSLAESEERFRECFVQSPLGMLIVELDGHLRQVNAAACQILGYGERELLRRNLWELTYESDRDRERDLLESLFRGEVDSFHIEQRYVCRAGTRVWVDTSVSVVRDHAGTPLHLLMQMTNISTRKQAEAIRDSCFNLSIDLMCAITPDGMIQRVNPAFTELMGYESEDLIDRSILDFVHRDDLDATRSTLRRLSKGQDCIGFQNRYLTKDGDYHWLAWNMPAPSESDLPIYAVARDVTASREHERRIDEARHAAEDAARAKGEFLACVSHEIRTPMNGILGMTELVMTTNLSKQQRDYIRTVQSSANSLLTLINDLLDFSKVQAGRFELEGTPFDLDHTIESTINLLRPTAQQKGLPVTRRVKRVTDSWFFGDPHRLRQVLVNLIGNAIKFTETGSVSLDVEEQSVSETAALLVFRVSDTGVGIPSSEQRRIFEAFAQTSAADGSRSAGTGLGLAIANGLVNAMGGEIAVRSELGVGSEFTFEIVLPTLEPPLAVIEERPSRAEDVFPSDAPLHVLVAEDNEVNQKYVRHALERAGHTVTMVDNGEAAVNACRDQTFDVVLMDMQMPILGGLEATRRLRQHQYQHPIVILSANAMESDRERGLQSGADDYLSKPVRVEDLYRALRNARGDTRSSENDESLCRAPSCRATTTEEDLSAESVGGGLVDHAANGDEVKGRQISPLAALAEAEPIEHEFDERLTTRVSRIIAGLGGETGLYFDLAAQAFGSMDSSIAVMKAAFAKNDYLQLCEEAHKVHGSMRILGLDEAGDVMATIERRAEKNDAANFDNLLEEFTDALETARAYVEFLKTPA